MPVERADPDTDIEETLSALSDLIRGGKVEAEVLPVTQRYGMGTLVWSPLAKGMLTGASARTGRPTCAAPPS